MAGLALKTTTTKITTKNYTRMKFIGLWAYYYLEWYLQTYVLMYGTVKLMKCEGQMQRNLDNFSFAEKPVLKSSYTNIKKIQCLKRRLV